WLFITSQSIFQYRTWRTPKSGIHQNGARPYLDSTATFHRAKSEIAPIAHLAVNGNIHQFLINNNHCNGFALSLNSSRSGLRERNGCNGMRTDRHVPVAVIAITISG